MARVSRAPRLDCRARARASFVVTSVLALCVACTSSSGGGTGTGQMVKPEELPERQRAVLGAWRAGGAAWELERERVRRDAELARFLVDNLVIDLVRAYERGHIAVAGQPAGPFERARVELIELAAHSTAVLVEMLRVKDGIVAFLCADVLRAIGAPALPEVLRLAGDERVETRRRAAELLGGLPRGGAVDTRCLETLGGLCARDGEWIVRAEAALALGRRGSLGDHKGFALGVLSRALADPDPAVGEAAARALGELGEPRAIPVLTDTLARAAAAGRPAQVERVQQSLARLSGETARLDVEGWRRWWRQNEARCTAPRPLAH